jgi:hypothetical protein
MQRDDPWTGLRPGAIDARRLDSANRHDLFWIVTDQKEAGLLLRLDPDTEEPGALPRLQHLHLGYRALGGGRALTIVLRDQEQRELFATLCRDIAAAADEAPDNQGALERALRRTLRWHHLLRGGRGRLLGLEEQRGLVGELTFLRHLAGLIGPIAAIDAWKGPFGSAKDFELLHCLVEVKARRGGSKPSVSISSEDQLADVAGARLFLLVMQVDAAVVPFGQALTDLASDTGELFAAAGPDAYDQWEDALVAVGFDFEHDYSDRRWTVTNPLHFEVAEGFPRITSPMMTGVSNVRYALGLNACSRFAIDPSALEAIITKGPVA